MKYIKKFDNSDSYLNFIDGDSYITPNLVLINSVIKQLKYNKKQYNLLDILYVDSNGKKYVNKNVLDPSKGYIPIGICTTPSYLFGKNEKARFMSLKFMNPNYPDNGDTNQCGFLFGNNNITEIDDIQRTYINGMHEGNLNDFTGNTNDIPNILDSNGNWNLSMLGEKNIYAVTDTKGKENTEKILRYATSQSNWKTDSTIDNYANFGYCPVACCCWRYHTIGTNQGDWYLPTVGEIVLAISYYNLFRNKFGEINTLYPDYCTSYDEFIKPLHTSTKYDYGQFYRVSGDDGKVYHRVINNGAMSSNARAVIQL